MSMFRWFKGNSQSSGTASPSPEMMQQYAPGTKVTYHPGLIDKLKAEHVSLINAFTSLAHAIQSQDKARAIQLMASFKENLVQHLTDENVKLYVYLEHTVDASALSEVQKFHNSIRSITRELDKLVEMLHSPHWTTEKIPEIQNQLTTIGEVLGDRIAAEEQDLYALYKPLQPHHETS